MKERQLRLFQFSKDDDGEYVGKRHLVKIHLDTIVLLAIINFLVIVIAFSLGVERGRTAGGKNLKDTTKIDSLKVNDGNLADKKDTQVVKEKVIIQDKDRVKSQERLKEKKTNLKEYMVQVASYLKEDIAKTEKKHLENSGFPVCLSKSGKYLVIYVGGFDTKKEAEKIKSKLKKRYSDCFVKKR